MIALMEMWQTVVIMIIVVFDVDIMQDHREELVTCIHGTWMCTHGEGKMRKRAQCIMGTFSQQSEPVAT